MLRETVGLVGISKNNGSQLAPLSTMKAFTDYSLNSRQQSFLKGNYVSAKCILAIVGITL